MANAAYVSVLLPTHNRRAQVLRACQALARQDYPHDSFEVLVVDNASTDDTAAHVQACAPHAPIAIRYLYEAQTGKVHALNTGMAAAAGQVLAFLDDDCEPRPEWLRHLLGGFHEPGVGVVAGPAYSHFPQEVEDDPERRFLARKFLGDFTLGETRRELRGWESPLGCNMAVLAEAARRVGGFSRAFGPKGNVKGAYEESDFAWRIARAGYRLWYEPQAAVDHYPDAARLTRAGLRGLAVLTGHDAYLAKHPEPAGPVTRALRALGVGLEILLKALRWILSPTSRARFVAEFRLRCAVGKLAAAWKGPPKTTDRP